MSFSFTVPTPLDLPLTAVVGELDEPDLGLSEELPEENYFPDGFSFHLYIIGKSARGVEVTRLGNDVEVRLLTCSSRADYELGLRIVDTLALMTGEAVTPEGDEPMTREQFRHHYDAGWIDEAVAAGPDTVLHLVDRDGATIRMSGPVREVHVGPRLLSELRANGPEEAGALLLERMIAIQSLDDAYYAANILLITPPSDADPFTTATWSEGIGYFFPAVDYLSVASGDDVIHVPYDDGPRLAGARWRYVDERQALVEPIEGEDWAALIAEAAALAATSLE